MAVDWVNGPPYYAGGLDRNLIFDPRSDLRPEDGRRKRGLLRRRGTGKSSGRRAVYRAPRGGRRLSTARWGSPQHQNQVRLSGLCRSFERVGGLQRGQGFGRDRNDLVVPRRWVS